MTGTQPGLGPEGGFLLSGRYSVGASLLNNQEFAAMHTSQNKSLSFGGGQAGLMI